MRSNSKTLKRSISPFEKKVNHKISEDLISDKKKKMINSPY